VFSWIIGFITRYSYSVLIGALFLEMIAIPLPGEALMSYAGFLVYEGHFQWLFSILAASIGAIIGMSTSYWIGFKLGTPFFEKYGKYIHMGPEHLETTSKWFKKYGNKLLIIAYFIPGVRHITGYFSGITRIRFRTFFIYASIGDVIWVTTFVSLGKLLGPQWEQFHSSIKKYFIIGGIVLTVGIIILYFYRTYKIKLKERLVIRLQRGITTFHSIGRVKFLIAAASLVFLGFFLLMIGIIQDYLANEFTQFNNVTLLLIQVIFSNQWNQLMRGIQTFASIPILTVWVITTVIWVWIKSTDKKLELLFLAIVLIGGEVINEGLRTIFQHISSITLKQLISTFPSEQSFVSIMIYGFTIFLLLRHTKSLWIQNVLIMLTFVVLILIGISDIYLHLEDPSDVLGGYVFGGMWVSLNVVLLEIYRLMRRL